MKDFLWPGGFIVLLYYIHVSSEYFMKVSNLQ